MGLIPLSQDASHSHREVGVAPIESRRFGQAVACALTGARQTHTPLGERWLGWPGMSVRPQGRIQEGLEVSGIRGHATGSVRGEGLG